MDILLIALAPASLFLAAGQLRYALAAAMASGLWFFSPWAGALGWTVALIIGLYSLRI